MSGDVVRFHAMVYLLRVSYGAGSAELRREAYPTFLSNLIRNSASTFADSGSPASTSVALDCVEADMVRLANKPRVVVEVGAHRK